MHLPKEIINALLKKAELKISTPSVGEKLSDKIFNATGERLGANTIKRLLGFFSDTHTPHRFTLDVIAHYLEYESYEELLQKKAKVGSRLLEPSNTKEIHPSELAQGAIVTLGYAPRKELTLRFNGDNAFTVINHSSSRLKKGDIFKIMMIKEGLPLIATEVLREGKNLGTYVAGENSGVKIKEVL